MFSANSSNLGYAAVRSQIVHRWYPRPVLFVANVIRPLRFQVDMLGFEESWHEGDGADSDIDTTTRRFALRPNTVTTTASGQEITDVPNR